jgi:hypothetical protein
LCPENDHLNTGWYGCLIGNCIFKKIQKLILLHLRNLAGLTLIRRFQLQELLPVGNESFDVDKFYADLLPESTDGDGLVEVAAQKFEDLMSVVKKRVHKKRAIGRLALDLGGGVKLGVSTYSFGQRATRPSKVRLTR